MIRIFVKRRKSDRYITAFSVSGHAGFENSGNDIVCAGVSAVAIGTVNAVEKLIGVVLKNNSRSGLMMVEVPESALISGDEQASRLQLLIESMIVMFQSIEESYGKFVHIEEQLK